MILSKLKSPGIGSAQNHHLFDPKDVGVRVK
jgi:hypothetical protein